MNYITNYLLIGFIISIIFSFIIKDIPERMKFTSKDIIMVMTFWPLVLYNFIMEIIKYHDGE
jgi:hypothetical protein